jgi:selenocysteine-specific elongation factor
MTQPPLTLGTAGHIDHGKTALIRALTGVNTDRLPQERARGISIELGYARLELPSGRSLSVVDVPGHERFVRAMVAGATGIDLFLMTVAADDGVMPQTREHASVLRALGVRNGVVAITKSDLADPQPARAEVAELLPDVPSVAISARTGDGLDELRSELEDVAGAVSSRSERAAPARLHVDRVFTVRGAGTVVTGTLWSGEIGRGDELLVLPSRRRARVRGVQVHDAYVDRAPAGQRVAVNLTGMRVEDLARGDVLAAPDSGVRASYLIDVALSFDGAEPQPGTRVHVHHGTREAPARMAWLGGRFWQLRLERPLVPASGDRLVIRQVAPPDTLGGGTVLDPNPRKHGPSRELLARLERLARGEPDTPTPETSQAPPRAEPEPTAAAPLPPSALALAGRLLEAGVEPPIDAELDPGDLAALREAGIAVRVSKSLHYHRDALADATRRVLELAARGDGTVTLAALRDELGTSRKFAQALLEHLDAEKVTLRRGDAHMVRASALRRLV